MARLFLVAGGEEIARTPLTGHLTIRDVVVPVFYGPREDGDDLVRQAGAA